MEKLEKEIFQLYDMVFATSIHEPCVQNVQNFYNEGGYEIFSIVNPSTENLLVYFSIFVRYKLKNKSMIHIDYLTVHPAYRGKGIGKACSKIFLKSVKTTTDFITLQCEKHLVNWYTNLGFTIFSKETEYDGVSYVMMIYKTHRKPCIEHADDLKYVMDYLQKNVWDHLKGNGRIPDQEKT